MTLPNATRRGVLLCAESASSVSSVVIFSGGEGVGALGGAKLAACCLCRTTLILCRAYLCRVFLCRAILCHRPPPPPPPLGPSISATNLHQVQHDKPEEQKRKGGKAKFAKHFRAIQQAVAKGDKGLQRHCKILLKLVLGLLQRLVA